MRTSWKSLHVPRKGLHTAHRDLRKQMQILTTKGWRTVAGNPIPWLAGTLVVRLTDGISEMRDPEYMWVRRINTLTAKDR